MCQSQSQTLVHQLVSYLRDEIRHNECSDIEDMWVPGKVKKHGGSGFWELESLHSIMCKKCRTEKCRKVLGNYCSLIATKNTNVLLALSYSLLPMFWTITCQTTDQYLVYSPHITHHVMKTLCIDPNGGLHQHISMNPCVIKGRHNYHSNLHYFIHNVNCWVCTVE